MLKTSRAKPSRKTAETFTRYAADCGKLTRKLRCAIYTRKSSEEGLDMDFNSLDAQRESCEAYISSQKAEGWLAVADDYDDGGFSGGTLERPALKRLLADVTARKIDVIVVYKIDRLSRSMLDFLNLVELFERHGVTFVSVTQSFNTKDAMGRMALNILVTFAQFEREVIGERIRDKVAASRKRGKWMGGWTPLGYEVRDRKLWIHEGDAERVRAIFRRFVQLRSATLLARELIAAGERNRYGHLLDKGVLYKLLSNRVYIGDAVHKGTAYPGEHDPIIDKKLWDEAHAILKGNARTRAGQARAQTPALLRGKLFGPDGAAMSPTHTRKAGKLYRYYMSQTAMKRGGTDCTVRQVPAAEIEKIVIDQIRALLQTPEVVVQTWRAVRKIRPDLSENDVRDALVGFDELWAELFPGGAGADRRAAHRPYRFASRPARHGTQSRGPHIALHRTWCQSDHATGDRMNKPAYIIESPLGRPRLSRDGMTLTVSIPIALMRQGGQKRVVTPNADLWTPAGRVDSTIVKALVRAHRWRHMLESKKFATVRELAKAEKINESYLCRTLRLTLLSPTLTEALLDGRQSQSLSLDHLLKVLPSIWNEQAAALVE